MRIVSKILLGLAWATLALALVFTVVDGALLAEGPEGFVLTAAMFGFAGLGAVSFGLFVAGNMLRGRPWLRTVHGQLHGAALAVSILTLLALGVFR